MRRVLAYHDNSRVQDARGREVPEGGAAEGLEEGSASALYKGNDGLG